MTVQTPAPPASGSASAPLLLAVGGMIALAAAMGIGRFVYTPILPFMADALSLSKGDAGLVAAANFLGYLAGALVAATGLVPGNRRTLALGALGVSAATTAAMAAGSGLSAFLALRFAGGAASAFVMVYGSAVVFDRLAAAGRPGLSQIHFAGVGAGIALSAVLVAGIAAAGGGWSLQWIAAGAVAFAGLLAACRLVPPGDVPVPPAAGAAPEGPARRSASLIIAYGLFGFGYVITATFISAMVRASPAIAPIEPVVWLAVGLAAIPSVALWGWVGRRAGNARSFAAACLVEAVAVAVSVTVADPATVLAAAALLGGTFMGITALGLIMARDLAAGDPRRRLALMTAAFGLGQVVGPAFAGYASEMTGSFTAPSLVASALLVVAAVLVLRPGIGAPETAR